MSAGGSADGAAAGAVDSMHLLILGIVGGLLCIYISGFLGDVIGPVIAGIGAVLVCIIYFSYHLVYRKTCKIVKHQI